MQVFVQDPNNISVDVDPAINNIVIEVNQGRQGRGISNITYTEVSGQYFLIVTYTDGTTETLGPLVVTGGAAFLLGGTAGAIPYQSAPNTTTFLPIGTANQVVVAGASAPQYTSNLTGLTVNNTPVGNTTPSTGAFTNLSASGTFAMTGDQVQISEGGTGQTTANAAFNALAPSQTGNAGKYLKTDGTNSAWDQLDISTADITGVLAITNGGTGQTTANSALNALLPTQSAQSGKYLKTDGTNASWDQLDISTADITGVLAVTNGGTGASTAPGARANLSAAVLGTNNDITSMTGVTGGISSPDFVQFDTTAAASNAVGKVYWDAAQGTLDVGLLGGNVVTRIGQTLVAFVTNAEAVTITKGQVVYLFGAQGDRATVKLAYNTSDATSAKTFGVVAENIGPNQTGFVMCQGVLEGLNLGAFTAGDTLYLGATPGSVTATKPAAPNHLVYVGLVERANAGNGQLYVKVQNGYELDEIHDVQIINPQNGQTIIYDATTSLWKNANLTAGSGISVTNGAASITVSNTGVLSFSGGTTGLTPATSTAGAVTLGGTLNVANGGTGATTAPGARTNLGLGTISTQDANNVSITGGTITGITDLAVADGGTGASNAPDARTNLGAAASATTITAGTGLTGGGDLSANRTISIANTTVVSGSYGSASDTLTATVNQQGQLTALASTPIAIANTQVSGLGTLSTQNANSVAITGGSINGTTVGAATPSTGAFTSVAMTSGTVSTTPASATDIANKQYVDTLISSGITYHAPVKYEVPNSTGNLNATYNNGTAGVGATLTNAGTLAAFTPDGVVAQAGDRILIYNQTNAAQNGVYVVTTVGSGSVAWVLTRASDADTYALKSPNSLGEGDAFFIQSGNTGAGETYVCNTQGTITFGTTPITFVQVSAAQVYSAGTGLTLSGTQFSITNTAVTPNSYGSASDTLTATVNAQGQLTALAATPIAIANTQVSGLGTMSTQNATNVAITGGSITGINDLAVADGGTGASDAPTARTNLGAAASATTISAGTGLSGGGDLSANRTISLANTTVTAASYGSASSVGTFTVNAQGQLTAAASTPIAITNTQVSGLGTMSTQNANSVAITGGSIDGTTIGGTTRAAGSFTTLTLTNALGIANGGTGQTTANAAFNALAPSQTGNAGKYLTTDGTNTSWATNPLGTVTSVDVSGGTTGLTTSGGPITSSGTITLGGTLATTNGGTGLTSFTANRVFYASSTSAIGQSANLTFDGTTLTAANFADSSLTSGRVTYASAGGNLTDSASLTFDGTALANINSDGTGFSTQNAASNFSIMRLGTDSVNGYAFFQSGKSGTGTTLPFAWRLDSSEAMRLTSSLLSVVPGATIQGLTVGRGAGAVSTNTAVGASALAANTTGPNNTAVGSGALQANTTGSNITAVGRLAANSNTTGEYITAVGSGALQLNTTGLYNTAVGYQALTANTTGYPNAAFGMWALKSNTTGGNNNAFGYNSLQANTTGGQNIAYGGGTLQANTTGSQNTAIGDAALYSNTTANNNTAVGYQAAFSNTAGGVTALGYRAAYGQTTGVGNVALGNTALQQNATGSYNVAVGDGALFFNTGSNNIAIGLTALYANTTGGNNVGIGYQTLLNSTTAIDNTAVGSFSMGLTTTGRRNVAVGMSSLPTNTTGTENVAVGWRAAYLNTTGSFNVAVGHQSLNTNSTGANNVAVGKDALVSNTTASRNTAVGFQALYSNTTGTPNAAFGLQALYSNTTGGFNVAFGGGDNTTVNPALGANTTGSYNSAFGVGALGLNTTASNNTAIGYQAAYSNTTGASIVAVGTQAALSNTTGYQNVAMGVGALQANTTGYLATAIGHGAGNASNASGVTYIGALVGRVATGTGNLGVGGGDTSSILSTMYSLTTGNFNTAVGLGAMGNTSTASANAALGYLALYVNTTGANNVALGAQALYSNTTASNNTAVGYQAAYTTATGTRITAVGYLAAKGGAGSAPSFSVAVGSFALTSVTSGDSNTAVGDNSSSQITTGAGNTAVGQSSLTANTTGNYNTALGLSALQSNTTASNNTAVGYQAAFSNTTGGVTSFGESALRSNTTGVGNVAVGRSAGYSVVSNNYNTHIGHFTGYLSTGGGNTFVGNAGSSGSAGCGYYMTTGNNNTIIGGYTGNQGGLDIRTANGCVVLSDGDGNPLGYYDATNWYFGSIDTQTTGGAANVNVGTNGVLRKSTSSLKYKRDVQDATHGLAEVLALRPVTYKSKASLDGDTVYGGLIAEEVDAVGLKEFVMYAPDGSPDALAYGNMVSVLVKAIQELKAEFDAYKAAHP